MNLKMNTLLSVLSKRECIMVVDYKTDKTLYHGEYESISNELKGKEVFSVQTNYDIEYDLVLKIWVK